MFSLDKESVVWIIQIINEIIKCNLIVEVVDKIDQQNVKNKCGVYIK